FLKFSGNTLAVASVANATVNGFAAQYDLTNGLIPVAGTTRYTVAANTAGSWADTTNWDGGTLPATTDTVVIRHAINLDSNRSVANVIFDTGTAATVNNSGANTFTLTVAATGSVT